MSEEEKKLDDAIRLESLGRVKVEEGDIVVLMHPMNLSLAAYENVKASMKELFPDNECIILEEGMTFGVVESKK